MTTLAKNEMRTVEVGTQNELPVIAADIIYQGAAVGDNASGYMRPLVAGDPFRGFALAIADNSDGAAGDIDVTLTTGGKMELTVVGTSAVTDVDKAVYATDDNVFTVAPAGAGSYIGKIVRWVTSTTCIVELDVTVLLGPVITDTVELTTAQVKALFATPATLVAAPGAGKVLDLLSAVLFLDYAAATYDTQGVLTIQTGTTGTAQSDAIAAAAFLFKAADQYTGVQVLSAERTIDANESLVLSCGTANPATGDSPVTVKVSYRILDFS
jgi:hypothetical protein